MGKRLLMVAFCALACFFCAGRANASVGYLGSWQAGPGNTTSVSVTTTATAGTLLVAFYATYNLTACPTVTPPSGWSLQNTPTCTSSRNETYIYTRVANGNDSATFTNSVASYSSVYVFSLSGASTLSPVDVVSADTAGASSTTVAAPNTANTTSNGDMLMSQWMDGYGQATGVSCTSPCAGTWTLVQEANRAPQQAVAYQGQTTAGAYNAPSATFGTAPGSIQAVSIAIAPAAASATFTTLEEALAGGPYTPVGVSIPGNSSAALVPIGSMVQFDGQAGVSDNRKDSTTQVNKYLYACEGVGQSQGTGTPDVTQCQYSFIYSNINLVWPLYNGSSSANPFHTSKTSDPGGTCPSSVTTSGAFFAENPTPYNWTSTDLTLNWFLWRSGGTIGNPTDMAVGAQYKGILDYAIPLNLASVNGSSSLLGFTNSVMDNCMAPGLNGTSDLNAMTGMWADNIFTGGATNGFIVYGGAAYNAYDDHKNWGTTSGTPYASMNCGTPAGPPYVFIANSFCSGSYMQTDNSVQGTYGNDTSSTDTVTSNFFAGMKHRDGTQMQSYISGFRSTEATILAESAGVWGGGAEEDLLGSCTTASTYTATHNPCFSHIDAGAGGGVAETLDMAAALINNTVGKHFLVHSDSPNTGNIPTGGAGHQWNIRIICDVIMMAQSDQQPAAIMTYNYLQESIESSFSTQSDVWPCPNFIRPYGRVGETYLTDVTPNINSGGCASVKTYNYIGTGQPCTAGGSRDPVLISNGSPTGTPCTTIPLCVDHVEWTDALIQTTPDLTQWPGTPQYTTGNTTEDLSNTAVLFNNTSSSVTLSSTYLSTVLTNYSQYAYMLLPCNPNSSYLNATGQLYNTATSTTIVCQGNTGEDVLNGGTFGYVPIASILNLTLEPHDGIILTKVHP